MSEPIRRWTVDNYENPDFHDGEMIDGWPIGGKAIRHGLGDFRRTVVVGALLWHVGRFVVPHGHGVVLPGSGFYPDKGIALIPPDIAFFRLDRLPPEPTWDGLCQTVPDLVADVRSVVDGIWGGFQERDDELVAVYLEAGVRLAWVVDPRSRTVHVRRPGRPTALLTIDDRLDGDDVLPGFRLPVAAVFHPPAPDQA